MPTIDGYRVAVTVFDGECFQGCNKKYGLTALVDDVENPEMWVLCKEHFNPDMESKWERAQNISLLTWRTYEGAV